MTQDIKNQVDGPDDGPDQDLVGELLRSAGRRNRPPEDVYQRVLADASEAMADKLRSRGGRRQRWMAAAAGVAALALGWVMFQTNAPGISPASVVKINGIVEISDDRQSWQRLNDVPAGISSGTAVRTSPLSTAIFKLSNGVEVRVDSESEFTITDSRHLALRDGRIYVDTGNQVEDLSDQIFVHTQGGIVRDIGTRFEVQYRFGALRLRVRDGQVELAKGEQRESLVQGHQLLLGAGGETQRSVFSSWDPYWSWTHSLADAPTLDGRPIRVLLEWVARETGRTLKYRDRESEVKANTARLSGNASPLLMPIEALALLETTELDYSIQTDGVLELWIARELGD